MGTKIFTGSKKRTLALFLATLLFTHHLITTVLYLLPVNHTTKYYSKYTKWYINSFFKQSWRIFAPYPPTHSRKMLYRCQNQDGTWLGWKEPIFKLVKKHQKNRLTFRGKLIHFYRKMFQLLLNKRFKLFKKKKCKKKNKQCLETAKNEIKNSKEYKELNKFVSYLCAKESDGYKHEFKIGRVYVKKLSERNNPNAKKKTLFYLFKGVRTFSYE